MTAGWDEVGKAGALLLIGAGGALLNHWAAKRGSREGSKGAKVAAEDAAAVAREVKAVVSPTNEIPLNEALKEIGHQLGENKENTNKGFDKMDKWAQGIDGQVGTLGVRVGSLERAVEKNGHGKKKGA